MKPVVTLWIVVLTILLLLTLSQKQTVAQARGTVVETDCVTVNVKDAHPCTVSVRYEVNGASYTQKMGVKPSSSTLLGKQLTIGYHPRFPLQIKEYKSHINPFAIPLVVWFLIGGAVLYFLYDPIRIRAGSPPPEISP
jgi:hypothetical protein